MVLPLVSVLMTSYNREKYIAEAIESVLNSTYDNFELIILDDGSTDNTLRIARDYERRDERIKVHVNEKNLSQWPTRNKVAGLAKGKYIKYLDSDDAIYDWGLQYCVEMMEKYPEAPFGIFLKNLQIKKEVLNPKEAIEINFFQVSILNIGPSGTILRRKEFEQIGFYNPNYGVPSDMYFNLEMAASFPTVLLKKEFFFYRVHDNQEYNNKYSYLYNNYKYLNDAINLPGFPLNAEQKKQITGKAKKAFVMQFLLYLKENKNLIKAMKAFHHSGISIGGFLAGVLKNVRQ